jgi:hypothetical protein
VLRPSTELFDDRPSFQTKSQLLCRIHSTNPDPSGQTVQRESAVAQSKNWQKFPLILGANLRWPDDQTQFPGLDQFLLTFSAQRSSGLDSLHPIPTADPKISNAVKYRKFCPQ